MDAKRMAIMAAIASTGVACDMMDGIDCTRTKPCKSLEDVKPWHDDDRVAEAKQKRLMRNAKLLKQRNT